LRGHNVASAKPLMSAKDSPDVSWEEKEVEAVVRGERDVFTQEDEEEEEVSAMSEVGEKAMGVKP
jgi:hypothetical protein